MRRRAIDIALLLAIVPTAALAQDPGFGPNGVPLRPPGPPDTSITRQQADQGRDAMIAPLKISFGKKSQEWTAPKLAALPHETMQVMDARTQQTATFSGVPLMALLVEVGVPQRPKGNDFRLYVVAEGRDGYKAVYSLGEVSPDVHDGSVLLADSLDGKPLADAGPIELICSGERRPARWIRGVVSIRVMKAD
jgi:Oxidoreductase molybdopterin binding domain